MTKQTEDTKVIKVAKVRKVDVKKAAKIELSKLFVEFLEEKGIDVSEDHEEFAFTQGTLVVHMDKTDVQVKLISPKHGLERYQRVEYEYVDADELEDEDEDKELEG